MQYLNHHRHLFPLLRACLAGLWLLWKWLRLWLLWRSSSSGGAEAILENIWQNGSFTLDDVNPRQGAAWSSFFRLLLRRQKMTSTLDRLPMRSPFQNRRLAQLLQEPKLKPLQKPCQRSSKQAPRHVQFLYLQLPWNLPWICVFRILSVITSQPNPKTWYVPQFLLKNKSCCSKAYVCKSYSSSFRSYFELLFFYQTR